VKPTADPGEAPRATGTHSVARRRDSGAARERTRDLTGDWRARPVEVAATSEEKKKNDKDTPRDLPMVSEARCVAWWRRAVRSGALPFPREAEQCAAGGLRVPWGAERPPLYAQVPGNMWTRGGEALEALVDDLVARGLMEEVQEWTSPGFYIHASAIPKPGAPEKRRLVMDARRANKYMDLSAHTFKLAGLHETLAAVPGARSMAVTDLTDAYFSCALHPEDRKYFRVALVGASGRRRVVQLRGLCMGAAASPALFQRTMMNVLATVPRPAGAALSAFLDDVTLLAPQEASDAALASTVETLWATLGDAGFAPSRTKGTAGKMTTETRLLGFDVSLPRRRVAVPREKVERLRALCDRARTREGAARGPPTLLERATLVGSMSALGPGYRWSRDACGALVSAIKELLAGTSGEKETPSAPLSEEDAESAWRAARAMPRRGEWKRIYARTRPWDAAELGELKTWRVRMSEMARSEEVRWSRGVAQTIAPQLFAAASRPLVLMVDASAAGWGARLCFAHPKHPSPPPEAAAVVSAFADVQARWRRGATPTDAAEMWRRTGWSGTWAAESPEPHSTQLELRAMVRAVQSLSEAVDLREANVVLLSDCSAAVFAVLRAGSRSTRMQREFAPLRQLLQGSGALLASAYLPGRLNTEADGLSRLAQAPEELRLARQSARAVARAEATAAAAADAPAPAPRPMTRTTAPIPSAHPLAEATIAPEVRRSWQRAGPGGRAILLDAFASAKNTLAPQWISWSGEEGAMARDALRTDWSRMWHRATQAASLTRAAAAEATTMWLFPPLTVLPAVLTKLTLDAGRYPWALVVPFYPRRGWFATASRLAREVRALPEGAVTTAQGEELTFPRRWVCMTSWAWSAHGSPVEALPVAEPPRVARRGAAEKSW